MLVDIIQKMDAVTKELESLDEKKRALEENFHSLEKAMANEIVALIDAATPRIRERVTRYLREKDHL